MPTYLCHGFQWSRDMIRIFVVVEDLEDATADWIMSKTTSRVILDCFATKFDFLPKAPFGKQQQQQQQQPESESIKEDEEKEEAASQEDDNMSEPSSQLTETDDNAPVDVWSPVKLIEEYDLDDLVASFRPFAYVADHAIRIDLSVDVEEEKAKYEAQAGEINEGGWLEKLRDVLAKGGSIGWYVVVCEDEERAVPTYDDNSNADQEEREEEEEEVEGVEEVKKDEAEEKADDGEQGGGEEGLLQAESSGSSVSREHSTKSSDRPSLRKRLSTVTLRRLFKKKESSATE